MYPWVTHTHSHLGGECLHRCSYCYVQAMARRFPEMKSKYSGPLRILPGELDVAYGKGRTIFIEHMNDLFAPAVDEGIIDRILAHCRAWPKNSYVFQTKNPARYHEFFDRIPLLSLLGTTIETNRQIPEIGDAPMPAKRFSAMSAIKLRAKFVTIEPIMPFDLEELAGWLKSIQPQFVNIGADSKNHGLPEPTAAEVTALIAKLGELKIEIRQKHNLGRLLGV